MIRFKLNSYLAIALAIIGLAGCSSGSSSSDDEVDNTAPQAIPDPASTVNHTAVVQTYAPDFTGSDIQLVDLSAESLTASGGVAPSDQSDFIVAAHNEFFYRIGRFLIDTIAQVDVADPTNQGTLLDTKDDPEDDSTNVHAMVFASATKAYLIFYGHDKVWIVNPNAQDQASFKLGELDLSAYTDSDGIPEATSGIIVDGKLYIAIQRINRNNNWSPNEPGQPAYVAVFDVATDTEIDTNPNDDAESIKGIELDTRNPRHFSYHEDVGLLLQSSGDTFGEAFYGRDPGFVGGITRIDTNDYSLQLLVDDGDDDTHPYGYITHQTIVSETSGYFLGQAGYQDTTLYHFNPTTGEVSGAVEGFTSLDIGEVTTGPESRAWIGIYDPADPRIVLLDESGAVVDTIPVEQNPGVIEFTTEIISE